MWATLPSNARHEVDTIALCGPLRHLAGNHGQERSPDGLEADGGDLALPGDKTKVLHVADNPAMKEYVGKTLVTTDGTTLADDKAGIAVIMEAIAYLVEHPELMHGPIRICFTCDEEIGHGVDHLDPKKLRPFVATRSTAQGMT